MICWGEGVFVNVLMAAPCLSILPPEKTRMDGVYLAAQTVRKAKAVSRRKEEKALKPLPLFFLAFFFALLAPLREILSLQPIAIPLGPPSEHRHHRLARLLRLGLRS